MNTTRALRAFCSASLGLVVACKSPAHPPPPGPGGDAGSAPAIACLWPSAALAGWDATWVQVHGASIQPNASATWNGSARSTVVLDGGLAAVLLTAADLALPGPGTLALTNPGAGSVTVSLPVAIPVARRRIPTDGLYTQVERRGWTSEYWSGELLQSWSTFDSVTNDTPAQEAQAQLDAMRQMGVNAVTFELRTADGGSGPFVPPLCPIPSVLGLQYPQPQPVELSNLRAFLDLAQSEGIKVWLRVPNTYMDESPPTNNTVWLASVLSTIKGHPALDAILFDGSQHVHNGQCGLPAEPPLWEGLSSPSATYVKWAIGFALDAGFPARQLSAEEVVGAYQLLNSPNLQDPVLIMRQIFDSLGVPQDQRTYAISMYEQPRCMSAGGLPCQDERPDLWAQETVQHLWSVVGRCGGARVIATEMGTLPPLDGGWRGEWSVENLGALFEQSGVEGGSYWLWAHFQNSDDSDPTLAPPVKYRGVAFSYSPVQSEIADLGGTHLAPIPNGSFEEGDGGVDAWTLASSDGGSALRYFLAGEPGQPEVATRGNWALRLTSGSDPNGAAWADSRPLPVVPDAGYLLAGTLRFAFSGDPDAGAPADVRPQVRISFFYSTADGGASSHPRDDVRFFQESSVADFATFPISFTSPGDAAQVQLELAVERNGLPGPLTADFDNLR